MLAAVLVVAAAACGSGDDAAEDAGDDAAGHHGSGGADASGYGSSMAPETVSVADVAELGPGPSVGDTWTGHLGLNVCGRFLDPPAASTTPVAGFSTDGTGAFTVTPASEEDAGEAATVGDLASLVGVDVSTGALTLPSGTTPAQVELDPGPVQVAGATFSTGDSCGGTPASVQLWIYTPEAAATGEDVRVVVTDPEDVPIAVDGMVMVLALAPASSLPTLPPSALGS